jgi:hypothetical protein
LTHRSACLSGRQVVWTLLQPDYAHSGGDRTAGDDDALASAVNELRDLGGETRKLFWVERVGVRTSENAGAKLEENAPAFSGHVELVSKSENTGAQSNYRDFIRPELYSRQKYRGTRLLTAKLADISRRQFFDKVLRLLRESLAATSDPESEPTPTIRDRAQTASRQPGTYKFGAGVAWIGVPEQCGGHGNGCGGRGVGIGLLWAETTAAMPATNKSKQRNTPKSRTLNFILGVSMRSMCSAEKGVNLELSPT